MAKSIKNKAKSIKNKTKKVGRFISATLLLSLLCALLCGLTTAYAAESIVLNPGQTEFSISVTIPGITNAFGGIDIDVFIDNGSDLKIKTVSFPSNGVGKVAEPRTTGNQVSYMMGFSSARGQNQYSGDVDMCTISFTYTGTQPRVITIRNVVLHRLENVIGGDPQSNDETLDLEYVYNISTGNSQIQAASAPTASPTAGTYSATQTVSLVSTTTGASIYYTTNGTNPTIASTRYTAQITVSQTTTIKAIAVMDGLDNSSVATFVYTISTGGTTNPGSNNTNSDGNNNMESVGDPTTPLASSLPFTDVNESDWFYNDVYYVWKNGLMNGISANLFSPNSTLTRGMVVTVLYRHEGEPSVAGLSNPFPDVATGLWYTVAVKWAADKKIILGYSNGNFGTNDNVTREQLAAILYRYAEYAETELPKLRTYPGFNDDASISEYAKDSVTALYRCEVINGKPNNRFDPKGSATRAEFAAMIHRFLEV